MLEINDKTECKLYINTYGPKVSNNVTALSRLFSLLKLYFTQGLSPLIKLDVCLSWIYILCLLWLWMIKHSC